MDERRVTILIALLGLALATAACEDGGSASSRPVYATPTPSALELQAAAEQASARETAVAQGTRNAMHVEAQATTDALANQVQATRQVLNTQATAQALALEATRQTWELHQTQEAASVQATASAEAGQATATAEAVHATSTAEAHHSTATAQAWKADVQATKLAAEAAAIQATAQAVERQSERERVTQPLRAWWGWAVLALAIPALAWLGWRATKVVEDRARVIRRQADEGEPFVLLEQTDEQGNRRIALPLRSFNALMDTGQVPALPSPEMQDAATMRQQTANAIQARQVGQIARARSKAPRVVAGNVRPALKPPRPTSRQPVPGLVKVVSVGSLEEAAARGVLPPRLAAAIEGQWHEVHDERES
jgi:hypothetical protein